MIALFLHVFIIIALGVVIFVGLLNSSPDQENLMQLRKIYYIRLIFLTI